MQRESLPLPEFFSVLNAHTYSYVPDMQGVFTEAQRIRTSCSVGPFWTDDVRTALLIIDGQKDFCFPEGNLYVAGRSGTGAMDDSARLAQFVHLHAHRITKVFATLDSHLPFQIFFPPFWRDEAGKPPQPHTLIVPDDTGNLVSVGLGGERIGNVRPNPDMLDWLRDQCFAIDTETDLEEQAEHYVRQLKETGKYTLYLWPFHCLAGSEGHAMTGVLQEAIQYHSLLRHTQPTYVEKGLNPLTENYSVFTPEVVTSFSGDQIDFENDRLLDELLIHYDNVVVAGQAGSHCVKASLETLAGRYMEGAANVYVLRDCMSAVTVPDGQGGFAADFTPGMEGAFEAFRKIGFHIVESTTPVSAWPGTPFG